jgi:hypothetical protein
MTDNGIKNWCWEHFFISSSEAKVTGARDAKQKEKRKSCLTQVASHQLEVDLKIKAASGTHTVIIYEIFLEAENIN